MSAAQLAVRERFGQLFDAELAPSIRRMGEQPRTGDPAEVQALRQMLWTALTDLGATRLLLGERHGGEAAGQQGAVALAELLGAALCQGPLLDTMTAAEALAGTEALAGNEANGKLLGRIAEGAPVVLAFREHGADAAALPSPITLSGDRVSAAGVSSASPGTPSACASSACATAGRPACSAPRITRRCRCGASWTPAGASCMTCRWTGRRCSPR